MFMFTVTCTDVRKMANEMANKNCIEHRFNIENKMAGKDWLRGFRNRYPCLTLRTPEQTSGKIF